MAKKKSKQQKTKSKLRQLSFLVGKWHTEGDILDNASNVSGKIRGMDTYEWIPGGFFLLHRVDVFMGDERTEAIEIIGYDDKGKSYFMQSFDSQGSSLLMYATLEKPGVLKLTHKNMRSTLTINKKGNSMVAKWERSENGKTWLPWIDMKLSK